MPCAVPKVSYKDICRLDLSECTSVEQASTCQVKCKSPYIGVPTVASCPPDNTDPKQRLLAYSDVFKTVGAQDWHFNLPQCTFVCPDVEAVHMPAGGYFRKDENSSWECAVGYTGVTSFTCALTSTCAPQKELVGCKLMTPCLIPKVDNCRVDTSSCVGLEQGASCQAKCTGVFVGSAATGRCAALNTDPTRLLEWDVEPKCDCPWPSLKDIPVGHFRTANTSIWQCNIGLQGGYANDPFPSAVCVQQPSCAISWKISGCTKTLPCRAPDVLFAAIPDQCQTVAPGTTCLARCLPTTCVAGGPLEVSCPLSNIDPERIADVGNQCRVRCEVCSLSPPWDIDSRQDFFSGNLQFGPTHAEGGVLTSGIEGFNIYFASSCLERIGEPVAYVPSNSSVPRACCQEDQYIAVLRGLPIPNGLGNFSGMPVATRLIVSVLTKSAGELPVGASTNFTDRSWNFTRRVDVSARNSAKHLYSYPSAWCSLFAVFMATLALCTMTDRNL